MFGPFRGRKPEPEPELDPSLQAWEWLARALKGRYRLLARSGHRHQWDLFSAQDRDRQRHRVYARPSWSDHEGESLRRWQREMGLWQSLRHPNLLPVVEHSLNDEGQWWVAPEQGAESLQRQVARERPQWGLVQIWLKQLLQGLDYVHRRGLVPSHLDLENILVQGERLWLTELAQRDLFHQIVQANTELYFDPRFLAPEQIIGGPIGPAANYFGLGCLLYELLSGRPAFSGEGPIEVIMQIVGEQMPDCSELPSPYPELIPALLARDPERRLRTPEEVLGWQTPTSASTLGFVQELRAEARLESENLAFTLDAAQALEKLKSFRFPEAGDWLVALGAAAGALGASRLEMSWNNGRLQVSYPGARLDWAGMQGFWLSAFQRRPMSWLALGLASGLCQYPGAQLNLRGGGRRFKCSAVGPVRPGRSLSSGLSLTVGPVAEPNWPALRERFRFAPFPVRWNGVEQERIAPNQADLAEGLRLRLDLLEPDRALAIVCGASFPLTLENVPGRVLVWGDFELDADRRQLSDPKLTLLPARLEPVLKAELERFCSQPVVCQAGAERLYRLYLEGLGEVDLTRARLLEEYLLAADSERLSSFFWQECWGYWLAQARRPRRFYQLMRQRPFLERSRLDWAALLAMATEIFGASAEAGLWVMRAWLEWELPFRPTGEQILEFWPRLSGLELPEFYDRRLQLKLQAGLARDWPLDQRCAWQALLPGGWERSRAGLNLLRPETI